MSLTDTLRRCALFAHFTDDQLAELATCASRSHFPEGVRVLRHGDPTQDAYVIETGRVHIQRQTSYGEFLLAQLEDGDLFGETTFVDRGERTGDAVAVTDCDLLTLNPVAVTALTERDPQIHLALYWTFWKSLSSKLRQTNERLSRFFSETGRPPGGGEAAERPEGEAVRVAMSDKRKVFEEQRLSNLEINFLTSLSRERKFSGGEVIFREGDSGEEMYVVLDGRVMISKYIPGAGEEALAFLERGAYFGEMGLIDQEPRSADAKADSRGAVVLEIPRDVLEGILDIKKVSSLRLLQVLCALVARRLRELDEKIVGWFILSGGQGGDLGKV